MAAVLEADCGATRQPSLVIVGRRSMQNFLVASVIDQRLGCLCQVLPIYQFNGAVVALGALVLLDAEGLSTRDIDRYARAILASGAYRIALINAEEASVNELAYSPGVRGIFFRETSQEHLLKGLAALLCGQYWLPRSVLAAHFEKTRGEAAPAEPDVQLTRKEIETLALLVGGHSNNAIARRLGVSPHTVRTHLYNLFRKIGAHNRVQAVKWGLGHLRSAAAACE